MLNHHTQHALANLHAEDLHREAAAGRAARRALREQRDVAPRQISFFTRLRWLFTPRLSSARVLDVIASLQAGNGPHGPLSH